MLEVSEVFESIQGEGPLLGIPALFIRLQQCNLFTLSCGSCKFCDTKYAIRSGGGDEFTADAIGDLILVSGRELLVITGGEPLLQQNELLKTLNNVPEKLLRFINVETNGTLASDMSWEGIEPSVLFSVSPKIHARDFLVLPKFKNFNCILKVVYNCTPSFDEGELRRFIFNCAKELKLSSLDQIFVMPQSQSRKEYLQRSVDCFDFCMKNGFRFGAREHVVIFDKLKGI